MKKEEKSRRRGREERWWLGCSWGNDVQVEQWDSHIIKAIFGRIIGNQDGAKLKKTSWC